MPTVRVLCPIIAALIIMIPNLAPAQAAKHIPVGDEFDTSPAPTHAQSAVRAGAAAERAPAVRSARPHDPAQRNAAQPPAQPRYPAAQNTAARPQPQAHGRQVPAGPADPARPEFQAHAQTHEGAPIAPAPPASAPHEDTQRYAGPQQPTAQSQALAESPTVGFTLGGFLSGFSDPRESMERALQFAMGEINSSTGGPGPRWARQKRWE